MSFDRPDPLHRDSKRTRERIFATTTLRHHPQSVGGAWVYCNCIRGIRGVNSWSKLGRGRKRDYRWADRWQCYGRRPDAENRW